MNDSCKRGEHNKCYSTVVLCSNPPQRTWICRECLAEGSEVLGEPINYPSEFDRLKGLKAKKIRQDLGISRGEL